MFSILEGLLEKLRDSCLRNSKTVCLLVDLHWTDFATCLLIGSCERITPCSLVHLINNHTSIYLIFASPYTTCYFQLMVHVWSLWEGSSDSFVLQIYPCRWWILITLWPQEVKEQSSSLSEVRSHDAKALFSHIVSNWHLFLGRSGFLIAH